MEPSQSSISPATKPGRFWNEDGSQIRALRHRSSGHEQDHRGDEEKLVDVEDEENGEHVEIFIE